MTTLFSEKTKGTEQIPLTLALVTPAKQQTSPALQVAKNRVSRDFSYSREAKTLQIQ